MYTGTGRGIARAVTIRGVIQRLAGLRGTLQAENGGLARPGAKTDYSCRSGRSERPARDHWPARWPTITAAAAIIGYSMSHAAVVGSIPTTTAALCPDNRPRTDSSHENHESPLATINVFVACRRIMSAAHAAAPGIAHMKAADVSGGVMEGLYHEHAADVAASCGYRTGKG